MNDNDILIARKTEGGCKTAVIDGEAADFERMERRKKERQEAEEAKREQHKNYMAHMEAAKKAKAEAERRKRKARVQLGFGMVLTVGGLAALTLAGLMHTVVGMAFIAGDAAAFGWLLGRNG